MAKCDICGKGVTFGIKVSHSHRRTNRTWKPNVKRVKAVGVALTLLQGLAVKGNMMYSITPLQAISQIISGTTVRRFDYIITIFQSVNYFAAIIFYVWAIKIIFNRGEKVEFEEI